MAIKIKLKKGMTAYLSNGQDIGTIKRVGKLKVYMTDGNDWPRADVIPVKKSKRARRGKAPAEDTLAKRERRTDHEIPSTMSKKDIKTELKAAQLELALEEAAKLTETKIQFKAGWLPKDSKMYQSRERDFDSIEDAHDYLRAILEGDGLEQVSTNCRGALLSRGRGSILCNYSLYHVLELTAPTTKLPNIFTAKPKTTMPTTTNDTSTRRTIMTANKTQTVVVLKHICQELKLDPRKARIKLRKTVGNTDGRWEWPAGSKELQKVKDILSGKATKPAAKAKKAKAPAKKTTAAKKKPAAKKTTRTRKPRAAKK